MSEHSLLFEAVIFLMTAVIFVPIAQKTGLGSVLGYLVGGLVIGPWGLKFITDVHNVMAISEMGVVFLLFLIGLELEPKRLWDWRLPIFGMGTLQIALCTALFTGVGLLFHLSWQASLVIGAGLSLSSTAIAVQILKDRSLFSTPAGQSAFSVLLFQDIAVIPILALLPFLGTVTDSKTGDSGTLNALKIAGSILVVILAGRFLFRHLFRIVASARLRESFTSLSLLIVVGLAALMHSIGVSMALGAFLGGVLLATSEYRHAIETDIEPFKGLLLGLFFMSVGMSVDLGVISSAPGLVLALVAIILFTKISAHFLLGRLFRMARKEVPLFSSIISQVGEFAFVLFAAAVTFQIFDANTAALLTAAVALSMAATPVLILSYDRWIAPRLMNLESRPDDVIENLHPEVIIAGFGRYGQIIGRLLYANRITATVLDHDPDQIEILRRFGFKIYYGDATRLDLLEAAGAATAKMIVVAVDDMDASIAIVDLVKEHFPHLKIFARARNLEHVYRLMDRGVTQFERETFDSSLRMGGNVLTELGWAPYQAVKATHKFRDHNLKVIKEVHPIRKNQAQLMTTTQQARDDLAKMFDRESENMARKENGWAEQ